MKRIHSFILPIWGFKIELWDGLPASENKKAVKALTEVQNDKALARIYFNYELAWGTPVLAHECLHCIACIFGCRGMTLAPASEEAYCYALEYMLNKMLPVLKDYEKKRTKEPKGKKK